MLRSATTRGCNQHFKHFLAAVLVLLGLTHAAWATDSAIAWRTWDNAQFAEARSSGKLILLDLEAVWCHWCHVMDEQTYRDPKVAELIARHYLPVKVDSDARPDLAERYRDYGWPATIILDADGRDVIKRAGYIEPPVMVQLLQAVVDDPRPEAAPDAAPQVYAESALLAPRYPKVTGRTLPRHP